MFSVCPGTDTSLDATAYSCTVCDVDYKVGVSQPDEAQCHIINAIIKSPNQNHWIKGFAGTGKTIVLTHIQKRLADDK